MEPNNKPTYQDLEKRIDELESETTLKESEERLEDFFNISPSLMVITNPEGEVFKINKSCEAILGYTKKEISEIGLWSLVHPDDKEKTNKAIEEQLKGSKIFNFTNRYRNKDGSYRSLEWQATLVKDGFTYAVAIDITERDKGVKELIKAKERAEKHEHYLNKTQEITQIGSWHLDLETNEVTWTKELYKMYGFDPALPVPPYTEHQKLFTPESWESLSVELAKTSETGIPYELELKTVREDGSNGWMWVKGETVVDKDNKTIGLWGAAQDISARKLVEEELSKAKQKAEESDILKSAKLRLENTEKELNEAQRLACIGSWLYTPSNQKSEWTHEMFRIWGFDSKNGTPEYNPIVERLHIDDLDLFNSSVEKASRIGTPYDIEFRIYIPDMGQKTIRAICQPVLGDAGEVVSLTGTNQDITSQKLFEDAQIKHQRLKAIGEMSSSIAHDFNNSLQEMMGNLEIAQFQNDLPERTLEGLNNIRSIISDVADRVSALQKFGDTEHNDKNIKPIDFNGLIEESLKESRPLWKDSMEKKGLKVSVITDLKEIPEIRGKSGELKSAIFNLIKNSIEAMPKGGDLTIKTSVRGESVFATITDTGVGMDEESKLKIFQPFYSTKGFSSGRGLGMSGVYSIVKKHGGGIIVKSSELEKGTTIEMGFPISQQEEIKVINDVEPKAKESSVVLWVDDDLLILESAGSLVEMIGHQCTIVSSGKAALEHLDKNTCDIVFTDIGMPNMNGWELADAIRSKFGKEIKIVAVSGWDIEEKVKEEHGIDLVLQKPFSLDQLKKALLAI